MPNSADNSTAACRPACFPRRSGWRVLSCLAVCLGLLVLPARAQVSKEYQIKAAFLYNFAKFVEWPTESFATTNSPLVIGVFGKNPFGTELQKVVANRKINGRDIVVSRIETPAEARNVQLLFFSANEGVRAGQIMADLPSTALLTIGETEQFSQHGGMIVFLLEGDKVRFDINAGAAEQAGLKISAQLQKLAKTVYRAK